VGNIIQSENLTKVYTDFWGRPKHRALEELNLAVEEGQIYGLLGPNGSGKTTTIKLLLGLIFPTKGSLTIDGLPPSNNESRRNVGFLPEESYFYDFMNADQTLEFFGRLFGMPRRERRRRSRELLEWVGLEDDRKRKLREYSKGMRRRVGLAQALFNDPRLVILDEPTSGLDPLGHRDVKDKLKELRDQGKTILLSSHLLADIEDVCDQVHVLHQGKTIRQGSLAELTNKANEFDLTIKSLNEEMLQAIAAAISEKGGVVLSSQPSRETLEAFFVRIFRADKRRSERYQRKELLKGLEDDLKEGQQTNEAQAGQSEAPPERDALEAKEG
jgi:ABC-2 type transport system ATP-binding protein